MPCGLAATVLEPGVADPVPAADGAVSGVAAGAGRGPVPLLNLTGVLLATEGIQGILQEPDGPAQVVRLPRIGLLLSNPPHHEERMIDTRGRATGDLVGYDAADVLRQCEVVAVTVLHMKLSLLRARVPACGVMFRHVWYCAVPLGGGAPGPVGENRAGSSCPCWYRVWPCSLLFALCSLGTPLPTQGLAAMRLQQITSGGTPLPVEGWGLISGSALGPVALGYIPDRRG